MRAAGIDVACGVDTGHSHYRAQAEQRRPPTGRHRPPKGGVGRYCNRHDPGRRRRSVASWARRRRPATGTGRSGAALLQERRRPATSAGRSGAGLLQVRAGAAAAAPPCYRCGPERCRPAVLLRRPCPAVPAAARRRARAGASPPGPTAVRAGAVPPAIGRWPVRRLLGNKYNS